jgi:hypothetical protein
MKNAVLGDFSIKREEFSTFCGSIYVYLSRLGGIYASQATSRSAAGGGSHREFSLLYIGRLGVIYDSQPHGSAFLFSHPD